MTENEVTNEEILMFQEQVKHIVEKMPILRNWGQIGLTQMGMKLRKRDNPKAISA